MIYFSRILQLGIQKQGKNHRWIKSHKFKGVFKLGVLLYGNLNKIMNYQLPN